MTGTSPSITVFSLSTLEGGDSGITGFTKIVWDVEGVSEVEGGTYMSPVLSVGHF
jgi:hypothetical protein